MANVAFIGVGVISGIYLKNISERFHNLHIVGLCDLERDKAEAAAAQYGVSRVYADMYEAFADPAVDIVLNLTRPYQHYEVTRAALEHGKHVYSEKPLAPTLAEGRELVALAEAKGLRLGGAPDTFMGAGLQTCRRLIDDGYLGNIVGATAFFMGHGPESWHPDPFFFYQRAGGPMLDMGPYYVTALINLLGPAKCVSGLARRTFAKRVATCKEHAGETIEVEVPTHVTGSIGFHSGAIATMVFTFDVYPSTLPYMEIYGTKGTLIVPDPNTFGGPVRLYRPEEGETRDLPLLYPHKDNSRGLGLADMAAAIESGDSFRPDCSLTFHALDVMTAFTRSAESGQTVEMETKPARPAPMPG